MVLWIALAAAFSPVLCDLGLNLVISPYDRCTVVPVVLLIWCGAALRDQRAPGRRDGLALLLAGVALEALGVVSATWTLARVGASVAVMGAARFTGFPPLRVAALAFFAVPVPDFLISAASPGLEVVLASVASHVTSALGVPLMVEGIELRSGALRLHLVAPDGGLVLLPLLMTIGWFHALRAGADIPGTLTRLLAWVLAVLPLQVVALVIAGLLTAAGDPELARVWLSDGFWPLIAVAGVATALTRRRPPSPRSNAL